MAEKRTDNAIGKKQRVRHAKLRLVPSRVAAKWGDPKIPQEQLDKIGSDRLAVTSVETLERVRRKLETKGEGMAYVRMELLQRTLEDSKKGTEEATKDGDEADRLVKERGLEVWLFSWDEMPESCVALLGEAHDEWHEGGNVR